MPFTLRRFGSSVESAAAGDVRQQNVWGGRGVGNYHHSSALATVPRTKIHPVIGSVGEPFLPFMLQRRPPVEAGRGFPHLVQTVLDCTDARQLAEFYRELLGFKYRPGDEPPADGKPEQPDWLVLRDSNGTNHLAFQLVEKLPKTTWPEGPGPRCQGAARSVERSSGTAARLRRPGWSSLLHFRVSPLASRAGRGYPEPMSAV